MESNNIILSPSVADVTAVYTEWRKCYTGSKNDFYRFMTTPSVDRDRFIAVLEIDLAIVGNCSRFIVSVK